MRKLSVRWWCRLFAEAFFKRHYGWKRWQQSAVGKLWSRARWSASRRRPSMCAVIRTDLKKPFMLVLADSQLTLKGSGHFINSALSAYLSVLIKKNWTLQVNSHPGVNEEGQLFKLLTIASKDLWLLIRLVLKIRNCFLNALRVVKGHPLQYKKKGVYGMKHILGWFS